MSIFNQTDAAKASVAGDLGFFIRLEHQDGTPAGRMTLAGLATFLGSSAPVEMLAITTPAAQTAGVAFTLAGTYTNGPPGPLDWSLDGNTWTASTGAAPSGGRFSVPGITVPAANASQTIQVRDHAAQGVKATSAAFAVAAAAAAAPAATSAGLRLSASGLGRASIPNAASLNPGTSTLDIRVRLNASSYATGYFFRNDNADGNGFGFGLNGNGGMNLFAKINNGAFLIAASSPITLPTGANVWVRAVGNTTAASSTGGGHLGTVTFYTATDVAGASWTQLGNVADWPGTNDTGNDGSGIVPGSGSIGIGADPDAILPGLTILRAQEVIGAATVLDVDFTTTASGAASFTASTGQTVTIVAPAGLA